MYVGRAGFNHTLNIPVPDSEGLNRAYYLCTTLLSQSCVRGTVVDEGGVVDRSEIKTQSVHTASEVPQAAVEGLKPNV